MVDTTDPAATRGDVLGLLARGDRARIRALADEILHSHSEAGTDFHITRDPVTGVLSTQIREPLAQHRFLVGDIIASQAEVTVDGTPGWGMCLGEDRPTALALAICDAEVARETTAAERVRALAAQTAETLREQRAAEWDKLRPTIVEFEEIA